MNLVDVEEQEMIGRDCGCDTGCNCEVLKTVNKDATPMDYDLYFDGCICEGIDAVIGYEENNNQKEKKFPRYR